MVASRSLALGGYASTRFWFSAFFIALMPTSIGYQDIAALLTHRPAVSLPSHRHLIASPFGTIEPATYSYGIRPIGTAMPEPPAIVRVNFDPGSLEPDAWSIGEPLEDEPAMQVDYPIVNRDHKGDRLPLLNPDTTFALQPVQSLAASAPSPASPFAQTNAGGPPEAPAAGQIGSTDRDASSLAALAFADDDADDLSTQIYFGSGVLGAPSGLERWAPGAAPIMTTQSFAGPGSSLVTGKDESRLESPAQRLGLAGKTRAKAEKCLADAVYFEARGEPLRGQEAVAQVVMNRVFSGYYPNNVCGVVYQNASHYLACQFTFACEHRNLNRIDEPAMWAQAKRIAKDELDGKFWLADIGHATHYHAYWVHPSWVHEMTRLYKLGAHTFYRPRAWGKGDYEPVWGPPPKTSKADQRPDAAAKGPEADAAPSLTADKDPSTAKL
jgi:hypothetical protein